jgi:hypothetical protein
MNYLPELREAMVDAARRQRESQNTAPASARRARRRPRFHGGRPLAAILVLCVAGGGGAAAGVGLLQSPAAVHAPAAPTAYAGVVVAGSVLGLAARLGERTGRSSTDPRAVKLSLTGLVP